MALQAATPIRRRAARVMLLGAAILACCSATAWGVTTDGTPPNASFVSWTESSPYAHYNPADDPARLWYNFNYSGSATARVSADDPDSGIDHVEWPDPPTDWTPFGSNDTAPVAPGFWERTFTWTAGASPGIVTFRAAHTATSPVGDVYSAPVPFEFAVDFTPPDTGGGSTDILVPGWTATGSNQVDFPDDGNFTDSQSSAPGVGPITRLLQRRDGVSDGLGNCDTTGDPDGWTTVATPASGVTSYVDTPEVTITAPGLCAEFRLRVEDAVGNARHLQASGFKGWDAGPPTVTVTGIDEGTNPQFQKVVAPSLVYVNGTRSGTFTVDTNVADDASGVKLIRFESPGAGWTPTSDADVLAPGPWSQPFSWTASAADPGARRIMVEDYAGNSTWANSAFTITRDSAGPISGSAALSYATGTWRNTTQVDVTMTGTMGDALSGVASYQLQRDSAPWSAGTCGAFPGTFATNVGLTVYGDPPPNLATTSDTGVAHTTCYRYRVEAWDHVGNVGYLNSTSTVIVDDVDPAGTFDTVPASASGTISLSGTAADATSGLGAGASATLRLEPLSPAGPVTTIYSDTTISSGAWGPYSWNTVGLNGSYRLHLDVVDVAGNVASSVATHDILLDNSAPTLAFLGFLEGTNPGCQHVDGIDPTKAWVKTSATCSGTIVATFAANDPETGVAYVTVPAGPSGWTPNTSTQVNDPGPWQQPYAWATGAAGFNTRTATATNYGAITSTATPFTIATDNVNPGGGALTFASGWHTTASITLNITNYVDTGSGVYHQQVRRDEVPRTAAGCGVSEAWPGTYATVVTQTVAGSASQSLPSTFNDTSVADGMCYRYRLVAFDNVSGTAGTSASPAAASTDFTDPTAAIDAAPASPLAGVEVLTGTAADGASPPASGADRVTVRWLNLGDLSSGVVGTDLSPTPTWSVIWDTTLVPDGSYRLLVDVADKAGNVVTDIDQRDVVVDNSAPVISLIGFTEGPVPDCQYWSGLPSTTFYFNPTQNGCVASTFTIDVSADDPPGGIDFVRFPAWTNVHPTPTAPSTTWDDATAPWSTGYTYTASGTSPGSGSIVAHGMSGATTSLGISVVRDTIAPTGLTFTGPGAATSPAWWTSSPTVPVAFSVAGATDSGSGVRASAHVVSRRATTNPACTGYGAWTTVSPAGPASPWTDATVATGTCYQYRVGVLDNVNNIAWAADTTNHVRVDLTDPTGTIDPLPAYVRGGSIALGGTSADEWSGVASISVRIDAGPAVACTPPVAASWSCSWDTTATPNGPVDLYLELTDTAGNVVDAATVSTYVDNEPPTGAVTLTTGTNPQWQHVVPGPTPRIYVNTDAAGGDFQASVAAGDGFSGVLDVQVPALGAGWNPPGSTIPASGPYDVVYDWTGPGAVDPGPHNAIVRDNALNSVTAPFEVVADVDDPTGSTLDYAGGPASVPSVDFTEGADAGAGIATWRIERRATAVTGPGTCNTGGWSAWAAVATDPVGSPWTDGSVVLNTCYQYRLVVRDNVGNAVIVDDPELDTITVEPAGIVIVESGGTTEVVEGAATDTYDVRLRTIPAGPVTISIATPDGQVSTDSPTLTFGPGDWNVAQTVTVTATDDDVDEVPDPHTGQVTHLAASATDADYDGLSGADVSVAITDDDDAGIQLSADAASVDVAEAGATSDTYVISLTSEPVASVDVTLGNTDGQVSFAPPVVTLDSSNWQAGVVVTVTAVDDDIDEATTHPGVVTHAVSSADPLYSPLTLADVTATVTDDDATGVTVAPVSGLALDEADVPTTAQYTVVLDSEPLDDVTITVTDDADATASTTSLLFTAADWDTPQPVTMTVVDDNVFEGPHTATVSHLATSIGDSAYAAAAVDPVVIDITDDDAPGIDVAPTGPVTATEGGPDGAYGIRLTSEPIAPVDVSFTTGSQVEPIAMLTFDATNWNSYQVVNVVATQDDVDEAPDPHQGTIRHTVASGDPSYGGWVLADMLVDITDDDAAGITVDELDGVDVDEANLVATDTFTVVLTSQPVAPVTVTAGSDAQTTNDGPVVFGPGDWSTPKTITVTAVDDDVDEAQPHPSTIAISASGDPLYDVLAPPPVIADVSDDDTAGIVVTPGNLAVDESGPTSDGYTIVLSSEPTANVTIDVTPDAQVDTADTTLLFTPADWATPRTVNVDAVDDPRVEPTVHPGQLTHGVTTLDPVYQLIPVAPKDVDVTDDDVPGIAIDELGGVTATEGAADGTYTIVLTAQPGVGETVTVDLADDAQVDAAPTQVVFDDTSWSSPATITVAAVDDQVQEADPHPGVVSHVVSSSDPLWSSLVGAPDVTAQVTDDDVADIVVTHASPYALSEDTPAATVSYDVVLATQPASDVQVDLTVPADLSADVTSLTFTDTSWSTPQTVTVNAVDDLVAETPSPVHARTITHAIVTGDPFYAAQSVPDIQFDVTDNDIPGITVDRVSLAATEGGSGDTFSVVLETMPAADVTVTLAGTQVGFDVNPLVFDAGNWSIPQLVAVDATDDQVDETPDPHAGLVELDVTSSDGVYDAWPLVDIPVDITDDDVAAVVVTPGSGTPLVVDEATASSSPYTVALATEPTAPVTITIGTADGQTTTDVSALTFTPLDWMNPRPVTVTAVNDDVAEAPTHPALVTHVASSSDPHYDASLVIDDQAVDVTDDDTAGIVVTPTTLALDEAAPATTASFDVVLGSEPVSNVDVLLDTSDGQATVDLPTVTFTSSNWDTVRTVTVTVVDDDVDEGGLHAGTIVTTVGSGDPNYSTIDPDDVTLDVADDDTAGVTVTETLGSTDVDEAALTDSYDVVLDSQPLSAVTITLAHGGEIGTDAATLTFDDTNWSTPQAVTVNGTPDALIEGPHAETITHTASSLDPSYDGIAVTIDDVVVNVSDDDVAGATITPTTLTADEDGTLTPTYDVVLDAQPTQPVDITVSADSQLDTGVTTLLTFTSATWDTPQQVTVTAVDDLVTEPTPHAGTISHSMSSSDADFNVPVSDVVVDITDNDIPGVTVTPTTLAAAEGGTGASFDVVLDSVPGADVTVSFSEPGQLDPIASVVFTPGTWNSAQTINVSAVDDLVQEADPHQATITIDTSSTAPAYDTGALAISDVVVDVADNDTAGVLVAPLGGLAGSEGDLVQYAISLTSEPTDTIEVTLAADADGSLGASTHTFTPSDWMTPQTVDVTLVQDLIDEGPHTTTITGSISSAGTDAFYGGVSVPDQAIDIADDDTAGVTFTPALSGPLAIAEGGATATYDIVLDTEPTGTVTLDLLALAGQAAASPPGLAFGPGDWMVPQTVTITADDDQVAEPTPHLDSMTHVLGGADPVYAALTLGDMDLEIGDDDAPGVRIDATLPDTAVTEGGLGDTVEVVLESEPTAPVDVTLTGVQVGLGSNLLSFDPTNWSTPQVVSVDAIDDDVYEGPHTGTIDALTASTGDPFYAGVAAVQHTVLVTDDDTAGVVVTPPTANQLDENSPLVGETYQVRLESEPVDDVDVLVTTDGQVDTGATTTLTFTSADWNVDQPVTVTPVDDFVAEPSPHPGVVSHDTTSVGDPAYGSGVLTIDDVAFDIDDNDTPGITITPTSGHVVAEGGATSSYDIVLDSQPTGTVVLTPVSTQLEWTVPDITFTTTSWSTPQAVTLQAIDDLVDEDEPHPGTLDLAISSSDGGYTALTPATVDATISDNDTSDLVVTPASGLAVDEAGLLPAAQYVLTLTSIPAAPVDVTVTPDAQLQASVTTVQLDATNWNTGVGVDVTAFDDDVDEDEPHTGTITHDMASTDPNFDAESGPDQLVDVSDDDTAGVTIVPTDADTTVAEDGSSPDSYDVVLESRPTANVDITITPDAQVTTVQSSLTFTPASWDTPQVVDVDAFDDAVIESPTHTGTITHAVATSDPKYQLVTVADEVANVLDDDVADVVVTPAGGSFQIAEGGTGDTLTVTLTSEPLAPVTILVATPDGESTATPGSIVLDASNWNTGVDIAVDAVDDGFIEPSPHPAAVQLVIDAGSDPDYLGVTIPDAIADVVDDDSPGVLVDDLDGSIDVDEADIATTDGFEVRLAASPSPGETVDVTIANADGQVLVSPTTLTFDDSDWSSPQAVTVTVVDDQVDEDDPHTSAISFTTASGDPDFDLLMVADVDANVADDDTAAVVVDSATVSIAEAGTTSQVVNVRLDSEPVGTVEVALGFDPAQVSVTPAGPLTFTGGDWSVDQPITIQAIDDQVDEDDPHQSTVTLGASSVGASDPAYDALAGVDVVASIADDDTSELLVTLAAGTQLDEAVGAATMTWDVELATLPTGTVDVTFVPDSQVEVVSGASMSFTAADWNVAKQVVVRAADDQMQEADPHPGLLAVTMGGTDPRYAALTPAAQSMDVRDDDVAGVTITQASVPEPIAEGGASVTYDIVLDTIPTGNVTVSITPDAQVDTGAVTSRVFTPTNWDTAQQVTVIAVDDAVTEPTPHAGAISHATTSTDPFYSSAAALVVADAQFAITDDDVAGFTLGGVPPNPAVDEADLPTVASYQLTIDTAPANDVVVDIAAMGGDVTVSPTQHTFPAGVAPAPVTITVTAVDDALPEGPHTDLVTHTVAPASDPDYLALPAAAIPDVTVDVADDDVAELLVDDLGGVTLDEAAVGTTDTFELVLGAEPTAPVDVTIDTPDGQLAVDQPSVQFTPADWATPKTITVTVVDDFVTEPTPHAGTITFTTSSSDVPFDAMTTADMVADIADDDVPALVITDSPDMTMDEADVVGTERTLDVALSTIPATPVTVNVVVDGQLGLQSLPSLTFGSGDWNTPQQVVVRAIDDAIDEADPHDAVLSLVVDAASDPDYVPLAIPDRTFQVADDDVAGVTFTPPLSGPLAIDEGGATASYQVVLDSEPASPVTIDVAAAAAQATVDVPTLTFGAADWSTPKTVVVTAVDDDVDEAPTHTDQLTHVVTGGDANYLAMTLGQMGLAIADDDTAGVTVTQSATPQLLAEDGSVPAVTYDVVLESEPVADVTVTPTVDAQVDAAPPALTFTAADWSVAQQVTVTAVDDLVDETDPHAGTITHDTASTDPSYDTGAVTIADATFSIADDDAPAIDITGVPPDPSVDEADVAAVATYQVSIGSVPSGTVDITLASGPDVTVAPATLSFDATNAGTPQTVTITVVDDGLVEGPHVDTITHAVAAPSDPSYAALSVPDVTVNVADDDVAELRVDDLGGLALDEGAPGTTDTFELVLGAEPTAPVDVTIDTADGQATVDQPSVQFTAADWDTPKLITVTVVDDAITESSPHAGAITFTTASGDAAFQSLVVADLAVSITDDDTPALLVTTPSGPNLQEADATLSDTVTLSLQTVPVGTVTVLATSDGQAYVSPNPIVFDSSNWSGVTLTATVIDDLFAEAPTHAATIGFSVVSAPSDPGYVGLSAGPITFQVDDDDVASISCDPGSDWVLDGAGRLQASEDPAAADHTVECQVRMGSDAAQQVVVSATTTPGLQLTSSPASHAISVGTPGGTPFTFTFTATDDAVAEGTHPARIEFDVSSTDPIYDALTIAPVDVDIVDDDVADILVAPTGPFAIAEGGSSVTVDVQLQSQPIEPVTITVLDDAQVAATPSTLSFAPGSWNIPQTITVSAVDDAVDEADGHGGTVSFTVASADPAYGAATPAPLVFSITDNDIPGVVVTQTDGGNAVTEGGTGDKVSLRLGTAPLSDVTVDVAGDAQVAVNPASITFTPTNWNVARDVTISALQDDVTEGEHLGNVTFALDSSDASYITGSAATPGAEPVTVTDDDTAALVIAESDGATALSEAGQTDTYTIALAGQPSADVVITPAGGTQVTVAPATLTFTPADWNTAQTVTLTAVQDAIAEPDPHQGQVLHTATTTAAGWANPELGSVNASIVDDDTAGILATQSDDVTKVVEGAAQGDAITFRLTSRPAADVSIAPSGDDQLTVATKPLVFGPDNWDKPVTLGVAAVDDEEVEGDHEGVISFKVTSEDTAYAAVKVPIVLVAIGDNDVDGGIDDFGEDEEEHEESTRSPRTTLPPATTRDDDDASRDTERRSEDGSSRTEEGRTRLPDDAIELAPGSGEPSARVGKRLGGEVVAAKEPDKPRPKGPVAKAIDWMADHWKVWAPLTALGMGALGAATYMLRADPISTAQRAAGSTKRPQNPTVRAKASKGIQRPHRVRGGRKKKKKGGDDPPGTQPPSNRR